MKKYICCASMNPPTEAIQAFDAMKDWTLIVAGDDKTPRDYKLERGVFISLSEQEAQFPHLSKIIGFGGTVRRNFALLKAHTLQADIVALVDDDNIPLKGWGEHLMVGQPTDTFKFMITDPVFDPVGATNYPNLWHRGFPIQLLKTRDYHDSCGEVFTPDVQADFWNGDPDVDAICRMEHAPECEFNRYCFPMTSNKPGPFNSQNTFILGKWLKDYFIFPGVGRAEDIWASYMLQSMGARVVYGSPSVYQKRNPHDLTKDFEQELDCYRNSLKLVNDLEQYGPWAMHKYVPDWSYASYLRYRNCFNP